jgi:hypothetical protein
MMAELAESVLVSMSYYLKNVLPWNLARFFPFFFAPAK